MRSQDEYWEAQRAQQQRQEDCHREKVEVFYNNRSVYNNDSRYHPGWEDQNDSKYNAHNGSRHDRPHQQNEFYGNRNMYNNPNQWQDFDRNRMDYERHSHDHRHDEQHRLNYNEKPWMFDRFAEKIERGWDRWVNRDYRGHTPDSDFSW